eukprot:TRINITY_DN20943_c0_g1_i1.p1 TRINITY_DN20943_c0_g1~~TRINITY_DN20943_c0_g1_i1.p1  ORF type:complete len:599 (-),score=124.28 TRINITY_DN20943_c0_g1_i1:574-2232(-)
MEVRPESHRPFLLNKDEFSRSIFNHRERYQGADPEVDADDEQEAPPEVAEFISNKGYLSHLMRRVTKTGVIYATSRAGDFGYVQDHPDWANLGQGAPECGSLPGQPERKLTIPTDDEVCNEYSHVNGARPLREAVARYYNELYRRGKQSQYTWQNVAITAGGRSGLCRLMCALSSTNVGYFLPEYTAYSQLLGLFGEIAAMPVPHDDDAFFTHASRLKRMVRMLGLGAFLMSNPCNPTGHVIRGKELKAYVQTAREMRCLFMMDEFYSHYVYENEEIDDNPDAALPTVSSARYVEDVNSDPICIINGFTKNWRLPGWRVCWIVGPRNCIDVIGSVGSFTDGGAPHPLQMAAVPLLDPGFVLRDAKVLQDHFRHKRDFFVRAFRDMGIQCQSPETTFYLWGDVSALPRSINTGVTFFEKALQYQVICVPGIFFDINPAHRRVFSESPFVSHIRFSFGQPMAKLELAVSKLKQMIFEERMAELHADAAHARSPAGISEPQLRQRTHSCPLTPAIPEPSAFSAINVATMSPAAALAAASSGQRPQSPAVGAEGTK